jgi:hypothetical protein
MDGTSRSQYGSEKGGYRDAHVTGHGTAYNSDRGNPGDARRVEQHDRYFRVIDSVAGDQADPAVNGSRVVLVPVAPRPLRPERQAERKHAEQPDQGKLPSFRCDRVSVPSDNTYGHY